MSVPVPMENGGFIDLLVNPLLNDYYQITMCYAYWRENKHNDEAVFDLFFRRNPFGGEFTVFSGLEDVLRFVQNFKFSESDLEYIRSQLGPSRVLIDEFLNYLRTLDCSKVKIYAIPEANVVYPKVPLITVAGPLAVCQLLETPLLTLVNYASLVTTNAMRFYKVANETVEEYKNWQKGLTFDADGNGKPIDTNSENSLGNKRMSGKYRTQISNEHWEKIVAQGRRIKLYEFGLRRAQGQNGALSASKYCYIGGFDGTSNVLAGKLYGIPVVGTQAHSFVSAFKAPNELRNPILAHKDDPTVAMNMFQLAKEKLKFLIQNVDWEVTESQVNEGELVAFVAYAIAFPDHFFALIDTYETCKSGLINFLAVAFALDDLGYRALGCRIDSGDISYLSNLIADRFKQISQLEPTKFAWVPNLKILASNDLNEETIEALNIQGHSCDCFAIGTHLVTCQRQPALGCVYKLVELNGTPRLKIGEPTKVYIPGHKKTYRLYGDDGKCILDLMTSRDEAPPQANCKIFCRHPLEETKKAFAVPKFVEPLQLPVWLDGKVTIPLPSLDELRKRLQKSMKSMRSDHLRSMNPTPYKVSLSSELYKNFHELWQQLAPISEIH